MHERIDVTLLDEPEKDRSWRDARGAGTLDIIEKFNLAHVLNSLGDLSIARAMMDHPGGFTESDFGVPRGDLLRILFRYLRVHGLLGAREDGSYQLTPIGSSLLSDVSLAQIGFYVGAYGSVVSRIAPLLTEEAAYGTDVVRDGGKLAKHCATLFAEYHTDTVLEALRDQRATRVLDLGCGAGQFLIDAALKDPTFSGVGLDIAEAAIDEARTAASAAGVGDRLTFKVADAFDQATWPTDCSDVHALLAVGVLHESFRDGEVAVIRLLNSFAKLFEAGVKAFILGEPEIRYDRENSDSDLLLVHIFTAQGFPRPREEWLRVIAQSRLECRRIYTRANAGPRFNFFDLRPERLSTER